MSKAIEAILKLIETFEQNLDNFKSQTYNEAQVRQEFINPLFETLGWDMQNKSQTAAAYKDVIHEDSIKIGTSTKAPDYSFRIGGTRKFFLEAKKPAVDIKSDVNPAYQLRRYAWSAKLPLSILTDFEEFAVYDCQIRPNVNDKPSTARIFFCNYKDYADKWEQIAGIFSKDAVLKGAFDKFAAGKTKRGTTTVDKEFLAEIEEWRNELAKNIALRNGNLSVYDLNFAVQKTIDRILFLRICEDRGIERSEQLLGLINGGRIYPRLFELFERADERYNSGIFHFHREKDRPESPDEMSAKLKVDDDILKKIIRNLYYPCPYEFSIMPAEILGNVYEQFLGKVIRLTASHQAKVEEKPEVKKAGGVYYTPSYIVDYIVKNTVGKLCEGKTPKQIEKIKILDPACGSGSFLIGAYQCLLDWHRDWYVEEVRLPRQFGKLMAGCARNDRGRRRGNNKVYQGKGGLWYLTIEEKKRILLNNIFGVDIDSQAAEVTKLSLLLKVLENETQESLRLFHERALPDLGGNIKCGNSLIGPDFYEKQQLSLFCDEQQRKINVFDWQREFADIFKQGGFDAVIGNPPYRKERDSKDLISDLRKSSYGKQYYIGKMDFWYFFLHKGIDLVKKFGFISFIVPSYWLRSTGSYKLIEHLKKTGAFTKVVDFGKNKIFATAGGQHMIFVLAKNVQSSKLMYQKYLSKLTPEDISKALKEKDSIHCSIVYLASDKIYTRDNKINLESVVQNSLIEKLLKLSFHLEDKRKEFIVSQGIVEAPDRISPAMAQKANKPELSGKGVFVLSSEELKHYKFNQKEKNFLKPCLRAAQVSRYHYNLRGDSVFYIGNNENKYILKNRKDYPNIVQHLGMYRGFITSSNAPYGIHRIRNKQFFESEKLLCLNMFDRPNFTYCEQECYVNFAFNVIIKGATLYSLKYLLGVLNSSMAAFWFNINGKKRGVNNDVGVAVMREFPVRQIDFKKPADVKQHDKMVGLVERMLELNKRIAGLKNPNEKTRVQRQIEATDESIDKLVYELYGLTEEDIKIVKGQ